MLDILANRKASLIARRREAEWRAQIDRALYGVELTRRDRRELDGILFNAGIAGRMALSNTHVRTASRRAMVEVLSEYHARDPGRKLYLITIGGMAGVRTLRQPSIDLVAFQRAIDKTLRRLSLTGILAFEVDVVTPMPSDASHPLLWHIHGVVHGAEGGVTLRELRGALRRSRAFRSWNGAVGAHIKPITRTADDVARVAVYLADPVHQLKARYPKPHNRGRLKMRGTRSGYGPDVILRATEIQSRISAYDAVFGVGATGVELRREWMTYMHDWERSRRRHPAQVSEASVAGLWSRIRAANPDPRFDEFEITTRSSAYLARQQQRSPPTRL